MLDGSAQQRTIGMTLPHEDLMLVTRRLLLAALATPVLPALAQGNDPRMAERSMGTADARVVVTEWFSLTSRTARTSRSRRSRKCAPT